MALTVSTLIWKLRPAVVTPSERLVLLALADYANDGAQNLWPAVGTLSKRTSLTRRSVQRVLHQLVRKGFIVAAGVMTRGSVRYGMNLERLAADGRDYDTVSQSHGHDYDTVSQSTTTLCHGGATQRRRGGDTVTRGGRHSVARSVNEPSVDPSLNSNQLEEGSSRAVLRTSKNLRREDAASFPQAEKAEEKTEERPGTEDEDQPGPSKRQFCNDCQCIVEDRDAMEHYRKHHVLCLVEAAG
jgi:Helix-turn-helix domain